MCRPPRPSRNTGAARKKKSFRGHAVPKAKLRKSEPPTPSGNLHLYNIASGETLKINIFTSTGGYDPVALKQVSRMMRCKRTGDMKDMNPKLVKVLSSVYDRFGDRVEIVSGFRNQLNVHSHHFKGNASDIRVRGVSARRLRRFVESLDTGGMGIGIYPRTGFVHVDVRPPPSYRWVDWARSQPNSADKRPPRRSRRRKLQS